MRVLPHGRGWGGIQDGAVSGYDSRSTGTKLPIMNIKTIIAIILVALGLIVLVYSGISFTTPGKPVEFLGLNIATTDHHFISPIFGAIALAVGILLLLVKPRAV